MILKRPYAFLVRHFRIIHALLLFCSIYLMTRTWKFVGFFSSYIKSGQQVIGVDDLSEQYVSSLMNILPLVIILICGIIIYLLHYKNKPVMLYVYIGLIYGLLFLLYRYLDSFLYGMAFETPNIRFINILRDVCRVFTIIQIPVIAFAFVRALGFDVKKFDFKKDLLDLGVEDVDNEEYEFEFNFDGEEAKAGLKKRIRMFKYFYKENRFLFVGIRIVLIVVLLLFAYRFFSSVEKIYAENVFVDVGNYKAKVIESYKTNKDARGSLINNKYFYLVTIIEYENKTNGAITPGILYLSYGSNGLTQNTTEMNNKLNEFGVNYSNQTINPKETRRFVFVFEVPIEFYNDTFTLRHLKNVSFENNELNYEYKKVKLSPKEFSKKSQNVDTKYYDEELSLSGSILGNTKIKVDEVILNDYFLYNIRRCKKNACETVTKNITASKNESFDLTLMRMKLKINYDYDTLGRNYTNDKFIQEFGSIRFEINGKEYNNRLQLLDVTPFITNEYIFLQVRDKLKNADKIYLDLNIRDKVYTIIIKDKEKELKPV